jgi:hypothetical protein
MTSKSSSAAASSKTATAIMDQGINTDIGVKDDSRKKLVETLNMRLCDEYVLYTRQGNITGML